MAEVNFQNLEDAVEENALDYEAALISLEAQANSAASANTLGIASATLATTQVQIHQSLTEMASGIAKNAADHVKGLGRKLGG